MDVGMYVYAYMYTCVYQKKVNITDIEVYLYGLASRVM